MKRFKKEEAMRKGIKLSVVAALSLGLLAGCGGGSKSKTASSSDEIKVWVQFSDETAEGKAWQQVVDNFNKSKKTKYKVVTEYIPRSGSGGGYEDKVNAAVTTNSLPDVITLDGPNTAAYAKSKVIAPLDDYLKDNDMDDVLDSIKQQGTYDGKFYAFGFSESNVGVYYNKKMFKEAGIDEASLPTLEKPWTWSEFNAIAKKLKDHFNKPAIDFRLNSNDEMLPYAYMPLIWSNGGSVVNSKGTKAEGYFNSKESVEAVQFIQDLVKDGYTTVSPVEKGFETGQYPMVLSGSWTIGDLQTNYKDIDFGILPYPVSDKTKKLVSPSGSWQLAVTTKSDKKEAAAEFVKFMTIGEGNDFWHEDVKSLSARTAVLEEEAESPEFQEFPDSIQLLAADESVNTSVIRPLMVGYSEYQDVFTACWEDIRNGGDPVETIDTYTAELNSLLAKYAE